MTAPDAPSPKPDAGKRAFGWVRDVLSTRLNKSAGRIRQLMLLIGVAYLGIGGKLVHLGLSREPPQTLKVAADQAAAGARPDRNGAILATDVKTLSVFAEPRNIIDKDEAVELITAVLPAVDARELRERMN